MKQIANQVTKISQCRMCKSPGFVKVISLNETPPANSFLNKKQLSQPESFYPLEVVFCKKCGQLQLAHVVHPDILFRDYVYVSSTSPVFVSHFQEYAESIFNKFKLNSDSLVIDVGSNDGVLLKPFKSLGTKVLGIDPAVEIALKATRDGIETLPHYLDQKLAQEIVKDYGQANVITANNVFAHVHDLDELTSAIRMLLSPEGVFVIEAPYLVNLLQKNLFDTIYHEHLSYLSITPLVAFFKRHQMKIIDVQETDSHGGSIRIFVAKNNSRHKINLVVDKMINHEKKLGLDKEKTYLDFAKKIEKNKEELVKLLQELKAKGRMIVGYGAPAKGNTLLNYFGIDTKLLDYIIDDSPLKQGLYTPGTHIPVVNKEKLFSSPRPDYVLILAWNFADPIMEKLAGFSERGGKFIVPVPTPKIIQDDKFICKNIVDEDLNEIVNALGKDALKLEGKTVLMSGGSGFLGSYINMAIKILNDRVLKKKCKVISLDNYITGTDKKNFLGGLDDPNFEFIFHDVRLPILIREKVDYIIHAAGLASPYYYQKYPLETIEAAITGAKNLLELARLNKIDGFLFFSSSEIYGDPDSKHVPTAETYAGHVSSVGPRACYDESKRLAETLCLVYHQLFGVPTKIVRPFNVYGPGMKVNDYRVVPTFLYKALTGQTLPVHDKGLQTRTFCYVADAVAGFFKVLLSGKPGEVYNIGNEKPEITMNELAERIVKIVGNGTKIQTVSYPSSYPAGEPQRRCPDLTKARTQLDYNAKIDIETGLRRSIDWFKSTNNL